MGGVVSGITGALGLTADPDTGAAAAAGAQSLEQRAVRELEKLDIPDIEKQKIMLELPKLVGLMQAEQLDRSAFEELDIDPALRENIMGAIAAEKEYADRGITEEDRARMDVLLRQAQADEQARQESIMQSMAERGAGGAGSELAARLSSNQSQADRAQQQAIQLAAQASQNRRQAAQNVANMSSQLDARDFQREASRASAADEIARFNAMNRQNISGQNLAQRQSIADQGTSLRNQQQMYNKGLLQQDFQNQMSKATGITNQLQNQAQGMYNQANREAQAAQAQAAGNRQLIASGATAFAMSDKNKKKNIREAKSDEFKDMYKNLKPKKFDYKDGGYGEVSDTDYTGVMAQDLEKSDLGRDMVVDTPEGKMVDKEKLLMTNTAGMADMNDRVSELEDVIKKLKGVKMPKQYRDGGMNEEAIFGPSAFDNVQNREVLADMGVDQVNGEKIGGPNKQLMALADALQGSAQAPAPMPSAPKKIMMDPMQYLRSKFEEGGIESPASYTDGGERVDELLDMGKLGLNEVAQEDLMEYLRGNKEADEMDGRIIEGESYSGDLLPDRINSGEMVINTAQQERVKKDLMGAEQKARGFNKLLDMLGRK